MLVAIQTLIDRIRTEETGASMVEYALLVVLIAIIAIVAISFAGSEISGTFSTIGDTLANP